MRVAALADAAEMQIKWRYFLKTLGNPELPFQEVMKEIQNFLEPVWEAIDSESVCARRWKASETHWE